MRKIILVRHGQTNSNIEGTTQGHTDTSLNETGIVQAQKTGEYIRKNYDISESWSSDLTRCQMTINQITKNFTTTKLLREMSFGNWENKKFEVLKKQFPELTKLFVQGSEKFKAPKGESFQDMADRSIRFISKLNDDDNQGDYLIVTHGGFLRILIISFLNIPIKNSVNFYFDNCSITEIAYNISNNSLLTKLNDTEHLK